MTREKRILSLGFSDISVFPQRWAFKGRILQKSQNSPALGLLRQNFTEITKFYMEEP